MDVLEVYNKDLRRCNKLAREEEIRLAARKDAGDQVARELLVRSCMPWVVCLAQRYHSRYNQSLADAIQNGNLGLLRAVELYDAKKGRLTTFSTYWIICAIRYHGETDKLIRIPHDVTRTGVDALTRRTAEERASLLDLNQSLMSVHQSPETYPFDVIDYRAVNGISLEDQESLAKLKWAIRQLDQRERVVLKLRLRGRTLNDVAKKLKRTRERIRQLEKNALRDLCQLLGVEFENWSLGKILVKGKPIQPKVRPTKYKRRTK